MHDYSLELETHISRAMRYGRRYPAMAERLRAIVRNPDPKIQRRVSAFLEAIVRQADVRRRRLMETFSLTPAEARVALFLMEGGDVAAYARAASVSPGTVRAHLKAIFSKTGVHRQAALVRLGQGTL